MYQATLLPRLFPMEIAIGKPAACMTTSMDLQTIFFNWNCPFTCHCDPQCITEKLSATFNQSTIMPVIVPQPGLLTKEGVAIPSSTLRPWNDRSSICIQTSNAWKRESKNWAWSTSNRRKWSAPSCTRNWSPSNRRKWDPHSQNWSPHCQNWSPHNWYWSHNDSHH